MSFIYNIFINLSLLNKIMVVIVIGMLTLTIFIGILDYIKYIKNVNRKGGFVSSDNFYVIRKHPSGGFTYVMGFASHDVSKDGSFNYDLPVRKGDPVFNNFNDALNAALEDWSEYGVFTHPECEGAK